MNRLAITLTLAFFSAMIMGAGPGVFLVNGKGPILSLPAIYAWAVFWFLVQVTVVVIGYFRIWKGDSE